MSSDCWGYTCPYCNMWVANNEDHYCLLNTHHPNPLTEQQGEQIIALLERIADALKKPETVIRYVGKPCDNLQPVEEIVLENEDV